MCIISDFIVRYGYCGGAKSQVYSVLLSQAQISFVFVLSDPGFLTSDPDIIIYGEIVRTHSNKEILVPL